MLTKSQAFFKSMYDQGRLVLIDGKMLLLDRPIDRNHDANTLSVYSKRRA